MDYHICKITYYPPCIKVRIFEKACLEREGVKELIVRSLSPGRYSKAVRILTLVLLLFSQQ